MAVNQDFEEFFALLNARKVRYLIVGGVAYNFYAPPRATKDIDVWVEPDVENVERLLLALADFGFPTEDLDADVLATTSKVLMLGRAPNRIDILSRPKGVDWAAAWNGRAQGRYGNTPIAILGLDELIRSKQAAARPRDLADAETLQEIRRRGRKG